MNQEAKFNIAPELKANLLELINLACRTTNNNSCYVETGLWSDCVAQSKSNWVGTKAFAAVHNDDLHTALYHLNKCAAMEEKQPRIQNRRFGKARDEVQEAIRFYALTTVYLQVPFKEKDQAKALGARFDGQRKQWFVPPGMASDAFGQWMAN